MKKKEFEDFPREYEKVYSPPEIINKKCDIGKVSAFNGIPGDTTTYLLLFQETVKKFQRESFDSLVKITWLQNRFCYKGIHRTKTRWNGMEIDGAYGCFMKGYVGMSNLTLVHTNDWSRWIISYFKDFFPNFNEGNPFEEKYLYPFVYMNFDCLLLVNIMPERMELLKRGEERKMSFYEFFDYVINYINCYNDKYGLTWEKVDTSGKFDYIRRHKEYE